jgi:hypothetical protein
VTLLPHLAHEALNGSCLANIESVPSVPTQEVQYSDVKERFDGFVGVGRVISHVDRWSTQCASATVWSLVVYAGPAREARLVLRANAI